MLEDTYAIHAIHKMFDLADVYGVGYDHERAGRKTAAVGSDRRPAAWRCRNIFPP